MGTHLVEKIARTSPRLARQVETPPQPTNPQHTGISHDALYENEQRLRALITASSDVMYCMSADWSEMHQLKRHMEDRGFLAETEESNRNWLGQYIHPEDQPRVLAAIAEAIRTRGIFELEHRVLRADGSLGWTLSRAVPLLNDNGDIREWFGMATDITARKRAHERERETERQLRQVLEITADCVISLDRNWNFTYLNGNAALLLAASGDLPGRNFWEAFPSAIYEGSPYVEFCTRAMNDSLPGDFEAFYPEPLDSWYHVLARPSADGITIFFRDITASRRASAALIQSEKLAAVGRLAASIAHEVNNPLESVTNLIYLARTSDSLDESRQYLQTADRELSRAAAITNQTLRFHKQSINPVEVTCEDLLRSVLTMHHGHLLHSGVRVEERLRAQRPIFCFDGEIRQVLSNLIGNATDAMNPTGGRLHLRTREGCNHNSARKGVVITVADTGPGMSPHTIRKAFEAFYTTKGTAGTGLGLWISKEIIARHNGDLRLRSSQRPGRTGTVFTMFLPYDAVSR